MAQFFRNANNGLMVNANGYTQRLPQLFQALLEGYFSYTATEDPGLSRRSPGITRRWIPQKRAKRSSRRLCPRRCSRKCRTSREMNGANFALHYVERGAGLSRRLKIRAGAEFMVIGSMTEAQAITLARHVQKQLGADGSGVIVVTKMSWSIKNNPSSLKKPVTAPTPHWQRYLYRLATMNTPAQRIVLCWGRSYSRGSTISCVPKNSWAMPCLRFQ